MEIVEPSNRTSSIDALNAKVAAWEASHPELRARLHGLHGWPDSLPRSVRVGLGSVLLALTVPLTVVWMGPYGGWAAGRGALASAVIGSALLLGARTFRKDQNEFQKRMEATPGSPAVWVLGFPINIAALQLFALLVMIVSAWRSEIDRAWYAGLLTAAMGLVLHRTQARWASVGMAALGVIYLLYDFASRNLAYEISSNAAARAAPAFLIPFELIWWTVMLIALFPQLQLLRVGRLGVGRFRGDFQTHLFGVPVTLALGSSVLILCAWLAADALFNAPSWIAAAIDS